MHSKTEKDFKSNSTSTIVMKSSLYNPNIQLLINAVGAIIHSDLIDDLNENRTIPKDSVLYNFSEQKYIEENPELFDQERISLLAKTPTPRDIS